MSGARAPGWPGASTRLVALLGHPVGHSLSPDLHNAAFAEDGVDLVYVALDVAPAELATVVAALGAVGAVGANVTVPHKQAVLPLCDVVTDEGRLVGAVNTLAWDGAGRLTGDNTDVRGLVASLRADAGVREGVAAVVLGTGGAARAVAVAVARLAGALTVVGRRPGAAAEVAEVARTAHGEAEAVELADDAGVEAALAAADLVINATPLGLAGEQLPAPFMALRAGQVAYDLVYQPARTPFLAAAAASGARACSGLGMLIGQAEESYRRWVGHLPPPGRMRAAADARLAP